MTGRHLLEAAAGGCLVAIVFWFAFAQRAREQQRMQAAIDEKAAALEQAREQLAVAELALTHADLAFSDLTNAHRELQDLHRESLDWGPLRAPRDCVREVILLDETAWPFDTDGQLAYCLKSQEWCEDERLRLNQDLDACFDVNFPQQRPQRGDPRDGDANSSWITWPEGHVIEPFPYLQGEDR